MTSPRKYRVIELFSGVGSQRMAFNIVSAQTGIEFEYVAQCDIDKYAVKSYNAIHGVTPNLGDITKVEVLPDCDILTWSFPCQSLSQAGRKEGMAKGSDTKSSLAWEVIRLLGCSHKPEWLVMENVPMITDKTNLKDFNQIINALNLLGYRSRYRILDATDFNVPQTRSRCLMVSRLGGMVPDFPTPIGLNHILGDFLEPNPDPKYYLSPRRVKSIIVASERNKAMGNGFQCFPVTKNDVARTITVKPDRKSSTHLLDIDEESALKIKTNNSTGWMFGFPGDGVVLGQPQARGVVRSKQSPTLTTHPQGTGVITEDSKLRVLTPRESWRLMGLCQINPDGTFNDTNYELAAQHVSNSQLYKQAGNSIVVDVLVHLYLSFLSPSKVGQSTIDCW